MCYNENASGFILLVLLFIPGDWSSPGFILRVSQMMGLQIRSLVLIYTGTIVLLCSQPLSGWSLLSGIFYAQKCPSIFFALKRRFKGFLFQHEYFFTKCNSTTLKTILRRLWHILEQMFPIGLQESRYPSGWGGVVFSG